MKKIVLVFILLFSVTISSCQEKSKSNTEEDHIERLQTPEAVIASFKAKYPDENDPDWEIDMNGNWESHFKKKGEKYRADFAPDGTWIETENTIKQENLPNPIKKAIKRDYKNREITEVEHVMSATKGEFYDVEFKQKGKNMDVEFRADGRELK